MGKSLLTIAQVASRFDVSTRQVMYAIKHGRLQACKHGWQWFVEEEGLPKEFPLRDYKKKEGQVYD